MSEPVAGTEGDGGITGGQQMAAQLIAARQRQQQLQAQLDEDVDIMRMHVEKILERDSKLSPLEDRADALQCGASEAEVEQEAVKLKRKYWWKNLKMMIIMIIIIVIVLTLGIIIGVWISGGDSGESSSSGGATPAPVNATPAALTGGNVQDDKAEPAHTS